MARCPFAIWRPISGSSGPHLGGPFKIVHHTTEGDTAEGAMATFARNRSDPHFTVDTTTIWQHVDTAEGARALRNPPGGVQTNRDSAVQIELVGFAHLPKDPRALTNFARLCRWIESSHDVPRIWPSGPPRPPHNGRDPGGHNRDAATWDTRGGHYGHCHVPENTHWDPAYSGTEAMFVLDATFDAEGRLTSLPLPTLAGRRRSMTAAVTSRSTMPDHAVVPMGLKAYVNNLQLGAFGEPSDGPILKPAKLKSRALANVLETAASGTATVNAGCVLGFVDGLDEVERDDVLYSVQFAQRAASGSYDRFSETRAWYQKYLEILENLGWTVEQMAFTHYGQTEGEFRMDRAALAIIAAIATQGQLVVLQQAISALDKLADADGAQTTFEFHSSLQGSGNFQLGAVQKSINGTLSMALGGFYFRCTDQRRRFLFFKWGTEDINFWSAAHRMVFNRRIYAAVRDDVTARLDDARRYVGILKLGKP